MTTPTKTQTQTPKMTQIRETISTIADESVRQQMYEMADNMEKLSAVLMVYSDKKNWRKMWEHSTRDYSWVFSPKTVAVLDVNMPPDELMESVARQVAPE